MYCVRAERVIRMRISGLAMLKVVIICMRFLHLLCLRIFVGFVVYFVNTIFFVLFFRYKKAIFHTTGVSEGRGGRSLGNSLRCAQRGAASNAAMAEERCTADVRFIGASDG